MDAEHIATAQHCLKASHDGSRSFPEIIGALLTAGFEGYTVDYRRNSQIYYLPDGDNVELALPHSDVAITADFDSAAVERLVRWAQSGAADYSYITFCERAKSAGCAGYLVSFAGRRVVYYGRTAETLVELFPQ